MILIRCFTKIYSAGPTETNRLLQPRGRRADRRAVGRNRCRQAAAAGVADRASISPRMPAGRSSFTRAPSAAHIPYVRGLYGRGQQPLQPVAHGRRLARQIVVSRGPRSAFKRTSPCCKLAVSTRTNHRRLTVRRSLSSSCGCCRFGAEPACRRCLALAQRNPAASSSCRRFFDSPASMSVLERSRPVRRCSR